MNKRIEEFNSVRDMPFRCATEESAFDCMHKSELLSEKLNALNLQSRRCCVHYRWSELPIPKEIIEIPHDEVDYHFFLEVKIPENELWIDLDPTWDSGLAKTFPIAEWDGVSSTQCAVPYSEKLPSEKVDSLWKEALLDKDYFQRNRDFLAALDSYLHELRSGR